jgi:hypothetical protein
MRDRSHLYALLGVAAVAVTRILFRSRVLYDIDSVNFALGMLRFDPAGFQPHPPGYFLYVCLARVIALLLPDANAALVAISIAASCGAAWAMYLLTREWFGRGPALTAIALFLVSPLCWFHGIVALTYIVEAFFSALIGYCCWRACRGEAGFALLASVIFALAAGFRPSTALLLSPLWLFGVWRTPGIRRRLAMVAVAGAVMLAWFIPMTVAAGGIRAYFEAFRNLWSTVPGQRTTLSSPWLAVARTATIAWIFALCFGSASVFLFGGKRGGMSKQPGRTTFLWVWITPGLLFFAFVFLSFVNSGYLLVLSPPLFAVVANRVYGFATGLDYRWARRVAVVAMLAANCAVFGFAPLYCSHRGVREFEREMSPLARDFQNSIDPANTLIVGFDAHFLGYRHAGYYLPRFVTVQYPEVSYSQGTRVFLMHERNTEVAPSFCATRFDRFVLFPLPEGSGYSEYMKTVLAKIPAGVLSTVTVGQHRVLTGPASALPLLFPATAR